MTLTKSPLLLISLFAFGCLAAAAQNAPQEFRGTVEYRMFSFGSNWSSGIYLYNADGTYDRIFGQYHTSGGPAVTYLLPAKAFGVYSYQFLDSNRGYLVSQDANGPQSTRTLVFNQPNYSNSAKDAASLSEYVVAPARNELVNTSIRTSIGIGKSSIAGFVVAGTRFRWVLIRAVGPSLKLYGVSSVLADPAIDLYNSRGELVGSVGSWRKAEAPPAALADVMSYLGAFPISADSDDSVYFTGLVPGAYTAVCHSISGLNQGEVLIEMYLMP